MDIPGLQMKHTKSHLQKYRLLEVGFTESAVNICALGLTYMAESVSS